MRISGTSIALSFSGTDPEGIFSGYGVFVSKMSRGWDYRSLTGAAVANGYWASARGWTSSRYGELFAIPPARVAELHTKAGMVTVAHLAPVRYFISVMTGAAMTTAWSSSFTRCEGDGGGYRPWARNIISPVSDGLYETH